MKGQGQHLEFWELADLGQFCADRVNAYRIGFEHMRYFGIYWNPFGAGTSERDQYIAGHEDARQAVAAMAS